jgi:hypothetical protein
MRRPAFDVTKSVFAVLPFFALLIGDACGEEPVDFVRQIQPILRRHCYQCHGHDVQEAGLRLDVKRRALAGGDDGQVIIRGKADASRLVKLISSEQEELRMPPKDEAPPLAENQIALIRAWVNAGAAWPDGVDPVSKDETLLWSFEPVQRPPIPNVRQTTWVQTPIDAFILAKLEAAGMKPAPPAAAHALIRRASFDLLGLPPAVEEVQVLEGKSIRNPQAVFRNQLDRLLADPHYGERWGRHWLDLARYADSNGYEVDGEKPMAWKYRDYVIRALNGDTPYDRFVMEQLAGDELVDATSETVIATGFHRVGPWDAERGASVQPSEVIAERFNELDDMVSTTSQVFLGLTMGCARCHDHKFDPLTAQDYYSMVSIFNPLARHKNGRSELTRPAVPPRHLQEKNAADRRVVELKSQIRTLDIPLRRGWLESGRTKLPADAVAAFKARPDERDDNQKQLAQRFAKSFDSEVAAALQNKKLVETFLSAEAQQQIKAANAEIVDLESRFNFPAGYFLYEPSPNPPVTHLLKRGNPKQPGPVVGPAVPKSLAKEQPRFESSDDFTSRRRISLARWIANKENPLTARVMVNRVWQFHFGQGLVRTPSDFGRRGTPPTHPELLDWLAHWFVHDADWSLKELHRLIMTSSTYQMAKHAQDSYAEKDPDNRLLSRFPYRRLEVEAIRDAMLVTSGQLNSTLYGPGMYPHVPQDARRSGYNPQGVWRDFNERDASRRTIYAYVKRTLIVPFLDTLDFCDTTRSAERRDITTVAPQALELLNGEFVNRQAKHFADRLIRSAGTDVDQQVTLGFRLALSRPPREEELQTLKSFWSQERAELKENMPEGEASREALVRVCRLVFNLNEFVYTD